MIKFKHLVYAIVGGILLSLPWITNFSYSIFIALVPLLILKDHFLKFKKSGALHFWIASFITFSIWNVVVSYFIAKVSVLSAISLWIINSFLMSLVWYISFLFDVRSGKSSNLFLISAWIALEFLQYNWDFEWTWFTLGNAFAVQPEIVQWYQFTGVFGGTLWILLVNISIAKLISTIKRQEHFKRRLTLPFAILMIPIFISLILMKQEIHSTKKIKVLIVQPNINPYTEKFNGLTKAQQQDRFFNAIKDLNNTSIDLIVGPETFLNNINEENCHHISFIDSLEILFTESNILIGATTYQESDSSERIYFNSALYYDGEETSIYHKQKLVSGVEKMPFQRILKRLGASSINLGGINQFLSNKPAVPFINTSEFNFATPICYEAIFGGYCASLVNEGADIFINITNDGWWEGTNGYQQHFNLARLRCVENGRSMIRAANTGISGVINSKGEIMAKTNFGEINALIAEVPVYRNKTFYTRHGDYLARMFVFLFVIFIGLEYRGRKK